MRFDLFGIGKLVKKSTSKSIVPVYKGKTNKNFLIIGFIIPIVLIGIYFYGIGRNRFFVRSDVVVRKAGNDENVQFGLSSLLGGGNQSSLEDAKYLRTYLESPQVLEELIKEFNFKKEYKKKFPDFYPGITELSSREKVYDTFRRQITIGLNESNGILIIRTLGFTPEASFKLNNFLIIQAENFVNKLNQDIYKKQFEFAKNQALENSLKVKKASFELQKFQQKNEILDVENYGIASSNVINILEGELVKLKINYATLKRQFVDEKAPEIIFLSDQIKELQNQIKEEKATLVSENGKNLDEKIAYLSELKSNLNFAKDLYQSSLNAAEKTRLESLKMKRFIAIISKPMLPEQPWQYWRHKGFATSLVLIIVTFSLSNFILGMADSHRN